MHARPSKDAEHRLGVRTCFASSLAAAMSRVTFAWSNCVAFLLGATSVLEADASLTPAMM